MSDERGATAVEFAMVLAPLILLTLGTINVCTMMYTVSTLHFAVEDTARWAAIRTTASSGTPPSNTAVQSHGETAYKGPTLTVAFSLSNAGCGNLVTGTTTYNFTTGLTTTAIPLSASACYPVA